MDLIAGRIGRQLGYLFFNKSNKEKLNTEIQRLEHAKERLQHQVDDARRNGEEIEAVVQEWLYRVQKITEEAEKFIEDEELATGAFPNLVSRYRLSRRAKKIVEIVTKIQVEEGFRSNVSYRPIVQKSIEIKENEVFETTKQTLNGIMEALKDPEVHTVGLWGMGGVGKTTLAIEIGEQVIKDEEKLFSEVVFTTVSRTPNIEMIRREIGERLGINGLSPRAHRLRQENNVLVILDDVWDKLDLEKVGISFQDNKNGCKILVTSRSRRALHIMGIDKTFEMGVLKENEALSLFLKSVGERADEYNSRVLATQIVKECGGLPIAIKAIANALKNRSLRDWEHALHSLRMSIPNNMQESILSSIRLSYDCLESGEAKSLLLLCSLFEEDENISIEELCNYGIGLNLFQGINNLEEARHRTSIFVKILKDHGLLLNSERGDGFVKLHDIIRDVVLAIASKDERKYNVSSAAELDKYLHKEKFKGSTAISLYNVKLDQYPETFESPELKLTRFIWRNRDSARIPHRFFKGLNRHKVLDLEGVYLKTLPSSFYLLQNLQTLHLNKCILGDITSIGELKNLKILDLSHSTIKVLPSKIGQLQRLQYLKLQSCLYLKVIHPNVISSLTRLEELNLEQSFTNWEAQVLLNGRQIRNASLSEVRNLHHLTNLSLNVVEIDILPKYMFSEKLEKYKIVIGTQAPNDLVGNNSSRLLMLKLCPNSLFNEHDFEVMLKRSEDLHLIGLKSVKNIAYELDSMGFPQLKHLRLEDSTEIRRIVMSIGNILSRRPALPSLETLHLEGLMNLEKITHGNLKAESFGKLREITVKICGKLKSLFSLNIARKLERITVEDCMMMEEIISHGREGDVLNDYHESMENNCQLLSLRLKNLPKLVQFCSKFITPYTSEKSGKQWIDDSSMSLFNGEVEFPKLESLEVDSLNFQNIWNYHQLSSSFGFQSLKTLIVVGCDNLNGLIPSSMIRSLDNLQSLCVERCKAMKVIVLTKEPGEESNTLEKVLFRRLENVELRNLPNLERFCVGDYIDCPSLLNLEIKECHKLQTFLSNTMPAPDNIVDSPDKESLFHNKNWEITSQPHELDGVEKHGPLLFRHLRVVTLWKLHDTVLQLEPTFQNVETLHIIRCDRLKVVLATPSWSMSCRNLTILTVSACHGLTSLLYPSTVKSLPQLTKLSICWCKSLAVIIASDHEEAYDDHEIEEEEVVFDRLEILVLHELSKVQSFYSGSNVIRFPCLNQLVVSHCPDLKSFSCGMIDSPKLDTITGDIIGLSFQLFDHNLTDIFHFIEDKSGSAQHFRVGDVNTAVKNLWEGDNSSEALQFLFAI